MSPFERHGITHLSASSINAYAADPAFWAFKYLLANKDVAGPSAWRGSAVEAGLDYWLYKRDKGAAQKAALDRFELEAMGEITDKIDKERLSIFSMLDTAIEMFDGYEAPTVRQFKDEYWIDGIEVPFKLVVDYEWPTEGIDLKTRNKRAGIPKQIPDGHARQISIYQAARGKPYKLAYVTEGKSGFLGLSDEEHERYLRHVAWYAHNIRRGLATFTDKLELARLYPPNFSSFYWSNDESRRIATEIWEL